MELVAVDQLTVTEAAAALGIRQVTARVRLHRARKALRDEADSRAAETDAAAVSSGVSGERTPNAPLLYAKRGEA